MQNRRTRITAGLASLLALAALALTAPTTAEAATGAPPGLYKLPGSVSPAKLSAGLEQEQAADLTTPIEPSSPHCVTLDDGNRLCNQISTEPSTASRMALTSPDDDDDDPGTEEGATSHCSITPAWTYSRFSYCYMSNVLSTLTHTDTGEVDVAHSIISGTGKLNRNTGEWTEADLITLVDATGLLANSVVTFSAVCSGACATTQSAAWSVSGVPMVPGESLTEAISFRDTPAPGAVDRLTNAYQFDVRPAGGSVIGTPASWSNPHAVRCDKGPEEPMEHFTAPEDEIFTLGIEAFCLIYVLNMTQDNLLQNLGAQPQSTTQLDLWDSENLVGSEFQSGSLVRVGSITRWAFCFETYGNLGADPTILNSLSQGTEVLSFNYAGTSLVQRWKDGQCVEWFEPMIQATLRTNGDRSLWDLAQRYLLEAREQGTDMWPASAALAAVHAKIAAPVTVDMIVEPLAAAWIPYVAPQNVGDAVLPPRLYQGSTPREIHKVVDGD